MGGGTKTMVGVELPSKSMTISPKEVWWLDPIKHPQKDGDFFSFSGALFVFHLVYLRSQVPGTSTHFSLLSSRYFGDWDGFDAVELQK